MNSLVSVAEARALILQSQGLSASPSLGPFFGKGKAAVLRAIEHLGYVQIDTISVVERAHHHVLWSRVPDYRLAFLHELQVSDRKLFEYWSHAAAYLPIRDFRFSLPRKKAFANGQRHWFRRNRRVHSYVLDRITAEGPLQARDFESPKKAGTWFDWKPAKIALEQLFAQGTLMIRERKGFQKVYDLTERVLPDDVDLRFPTPREYAEHLIESTLRSHGLASEREIQYLRKGIQNAVKNTLRDLSENGRIFPVQIRGEKKTEPYYCLASVNLSSLSPHSGVHILSPFDNLVIQRRRLRRFFDFDYQIECYLPEEKRRFGYFCLPILWNGKLAGRLDAKADREHSTLEIRSLHLEISARSKKVFRAEFTPALESFAAFNGCERTSFP